MGFEEEARYSLAHAGEHELGHGLASSTCGIGTSAGDLQGVGDIEDDGASRAFHDAEVQGVDHEVVVAEAGPALAEYYLFVAPLRRICL